MSDELITLQELADAKHDVNDIEKFANSFDKDTNQFISQYVSRLPENNGKTVKTISGITNEVYSKIIMTPLTSDGQWLSGESFDQYNQYMVYNGTPYKPKYSTTLPYLSTTTPDFDFVEPFTDLTSANISKYTNIIFADEASLLSGNSIDGRMITHTENNNYITLSRNEDDDLFSHHWSVSSTETPNGHTKLDLGGGLTAVMVGVHGENNNFIQNTAYADPLNRFMFGMEYSYALVKSFYDFPSTFAVPQIIHSGDSTTAGDNAGGFDPSVVMYNYCENYGLPSQQINAGHSGQDTVAWNSTYVDSDIATYPNMNCYFVRWGINDGASHGNVDTYETALRSGLTKLRAFKGLADLTIVLMSPSSTYDPQNNRDEKWYESLAGIIKKAARDFQCVYFDTYAMFRDSYNGAGIYLDNPYSDGRGIHPSKEFNSVIYNELAKYLFGSLSGLKRNLNRYSNIASSQFMPSETVPVSDYHYGRSIFRAITANGWPLDGSVITEKSADGILVQKNIEYPASSAQRVYERIGSVVDGVFSSWRKHGIFLLSYASGWEPTPGLEPLRIHLSGQMATVTGSATFTSGNPPDGSIIATVPSDIVPQNAIQFVAKTQNGTTYDFCIISIESNGNVSVYGGEDGVSIGINGSWVPQSTV